MKPVQCHAVKYELSTEGYYAFFQVKEVDVSLPIVLQAVNLLRATLPKHWIPVADGNGIHCLLLSRGSQKATQRNVYCDFGGTVKVDVHCKSLPDHLQQEIESSAPPPIPLCDSTVKGFVDRLQSVVIKVRSYEVCAGQDLRSYEAFWSSDNQGMVDCNPYCESRYEKTFRTFACHLLVNPLKWKCKE